MSSKIKKKPNVILIMTDDQGYGDFSWAGNPIVKTPNIDKLYGESVRLEDFHVAPMCTPSRGQLLTGRDALSNGAYNVFAGRTMIRKDIPTIADVMKGNGYKTGQFGKWHLGPNYPFRPQDRGFEETLHFRGSCITASSDYWQNDCFDDTYWHNGELEKYDGYCTDVFFREMKNWVLECVEKDEPFFAYLPLNAPHFPHFVPERFKEPYKGATYNGNPLTNDQIGFFGMIANTDENMGLLDGMLEEYGIKDNTILIFLTDNGGTAGVDIYNAGMRGSKCSYYDGGHRVPCLIRWTDGNLISGQNINDLTECQDILPSLMEMCEIESYPSFEAEGKSLFPLLTGKTDKLDERILVVQYSWTPIDRLPKKWECAVMKDKWRLVNGNELYDISKDIGQENNLIDEYPEIVQELKDYYEKWWSKFSPRAGERTNIIIGSEHEKYTFLSSHDWLETRCSHNFNILAGVVQKGPWNITIEKDGLYEFELRRWPKEADSPLGSAMDAYEPTDNTEFHRDYYPEGVSLPIGYARIQIADKDEMCEVQEDAKSVTFKLELGAGDTQLHAKFYHKNKIEMWGAYYVYVQMVK